MEFPVDLLETVDPEALEQSAKDYMSKLFYRTPGIHETLCLHDSREVEIDICNMGFMPLYGVNIKQKILALFSPEDRYKAVGLYLLDQWWSAEDILKTADPSRTGLLEVGTPGERIVLYVLNRIIYRTKENSSGDVPFLCHEEHEIAKILWKDGEAIGFYSVKPEGSLCSSFLTQCYQLPVMDTIFVRKCHRGKGYGLQMLEDFVSSFKKDYLGLKYPLSTAMYKVCKNYLSTYPEDEELLWEVEGTGGLFQRTLIARKLQKLELKGGHQVVGKLNFETDVSDIPMEEVTTKVQNNMEYTVEIVEEVVQIKITKEAQDIPVTTRGRSSQKRKKLGGDTEATTEKIIRVEDIEAGVQSPVEPMPVVVQSVEEADLEKRTVTVTHGEENVLGVTLVHCEEQEELTAEPNESVQEVCALTAPTTVTPEEDLEETEFEATTGLVSLQPLEFQQVVEMEIVKKTSGVEDIKETIIEVTEIKDGRGDAEEEIDVISEVVEAKLTNEEITCLQTELDLKPVSMSSEDRSSTETGVLRRSSRKSTAAVTSQRKFTQGGKVGQQAENAQALDKPENEKDAEIISEGIRPEQSEIENKEGTSVNFDVDQAEEEDNGAFEEQLKQPDVTGTMDGEFEPAEKGNAEKAEVEKIGESGNVVVEAGEKNNENMETDEALNECAEQEQMERLQEEEHIRDTNMVQESMCEKEKETKAQELSHDDDDDEVKSDKRPELIEGDASEKAGPTGRRAKSQSLKGATPLRRSERFVDQIVEGELTRRALRSGTKSVTTISKQRCVQDIKVVKRKEDVMKPHTRVTELEEQKEAKMDIVSITIAGDGENRMDNVEEESKVEKDSELGTSIDHDLNKVENKTEDGSHNETTEAADEITVMHFEGAETQVEKETRQMQQMEETSSGTVQKDAGQNVVDCTSVCTLQQAAVVLTDLKQIPPEQIGINETTKEISQSREGQGVAGMDLEDSDIVKDTAERKTTEEPFGEPVEEEDEEPTTEMAQKDDVVQSTSVFILQEAAVVLVDCNKASPQKTDGSDNDETLLSLDRQECKEEGGVENQTEYLVEQTEEKQTCGSETSTETGQKEDGLNEAKVAEKDDPFTEIGVEEPIKENLDKQDLEMGTDNMPETNTNEERSMSAEEQVITFEEESVKTADIYISESEKRKKEEHLGTSGLPEEDASVITSRTLRRRTVTVKSLPQQKSKRAQKTVLETAELENVKMAEAVDIMDTGISEEKGENKDEKSQDRAIDLTEDQIQKPCVTDQGQMEVVQEEPVKDNSTPQSMLGSEESTMKEVIVLRPADESEVSDNNFAEVEKDADIEDKSQEPPASEPVEMQVKEAAIEVPGEGEQTAEETTEDVKLQNASVVLVDINKVSIQESTEDTLEPQEKECKEPDKPADVSMHMDESKAEQEVMKQTDIQFEATEVQEKELLKETTKVQDTEHSEADSKLKQCDNEKADIRTPKRQSRQPVDQFAVSELTTRVLRSSTKQAIASPSQRQTRHTKAKMQIEEPEQTVDEPEEKREQMLDLQADIAEGDKRENVATEGAAPNLTSTLECRLEESKVENDELRAEIIEDSESKEEETHPQDENTVDDDIRTEKCSESDQVTTEDVVLEEAAGATTENKASDYVSAIPEDAEIEAEGSIALSVKEQDEALVSETAEKEEGQNAVDSALGFTLQNAAVVLVDLNKVHPKITSDSENTEETSQSQEEVEKEVNTGEDKAESNEDEEMEQTESLVETEKEQTDEKSIETASQEKEGQNSTVLEEKDAFAVTNKGESMTEVMEETPMDEDADSALKTSSEQVESVLAEDKGKDDQAGNITLKEESVATVSAKVESVQEGLSEEETPIITSRSLRRRTITVKSSVQIKSKQVPKSSVQEEMKKPELDKETDVNKAEKTSVCISVEAEMPKTSSEISSEDGKMTSKMEKQEPISEQQEVEALVPEEIPDAGLKLSEDMADEGNSLINESEDKEKGEIPPDTAATIEVGDKGEESVLDESGDAQVSSEEMSKEIVTVDKHKDKTPTETDGEMVGGNPEQEKLLEETTGGVCRISEEEEKEEKGNMSTTEEILEVEGEVGVTSRSLRKRTITIKTTPERKSKRLRKQDQDVDLAEDPLPGEEPVESLAENQAIETQATSQEQCDSDSKKEMLSEISQEHKNPEGEETRPEKEEAQLQELINVSTEETGSKVEAQDSDKGEVEEENIAEADACKEGTAEHENESTGKDTAPDTVEEVEEKQDNAEPNEKNGKECSEISLALNEGFTLELDEEDENSGPEKNNSMKETEASLTEHPVVASTSIQNKDSNEEHVTDQEEQPSVKKKHVLQKSSASPNQRRTRRSERFPRESQSEAEDMSEAEAILEENEEKKISQQKRKAIVDLTPRRSKRLARPKMV